MPGTQGRGQTTVAGGGGMQWENQRAIRWVGAYLYIDMHVSTLYFSFFLRCFSLRSFWGWGADMYMHTCIRIHMYSLGPWL